MNIYFLFVYDKYFENKNKNILNNKKDVNYLFG
jgi:hypothetical protein